jgi:iron(III) transport system substrate-binding protein
MNVRRRLLAGLIGAAAIATSAPAFAAADMAAAKTEGKIVWYTSAPIKQAQQLVNMFKDKTGLEVELFRSGGSAIMRRYLQERDAKRAYCDVLTTSDPAEMTMLAEKGAFTAFKPDGIEQVPKDAIEPHNFYVGQRLNIVANYYRDDKISDADAPKTMKDLLDPKHKSKMVMADPSFSSLQLAVVGMTAKTLGWDYYAKLRKNDTMVVQGAQQVVEMVKRGERLIAVGASDSYATSARAEGRAIKTIEPPDGTFLIPSPTAIIADAPHPNAAKVFVDFLLSKEAQALVPASGGYAARKDIPPPKGNAPLASITTTPVDYSYIEKNAGAIKKKFNEVFE